MGFNAKELRQILGCYGTGVAIITAVNEKGADIGVTINSFSSASLDPPLILFSMANTSNFTCVLQHSKYFIVNILAHNQEANATAFAKPSSVDWSEVCTFRGNNECAKLSGSIAFLECRLESTFPGGDHQVLVGKVEHIDSGTSNDPLFFYRGSFGTHQKNSKVIPDLLQSADFNFIDHVWS